MSLSVPRAVRWLPAPIAAAYVVTVAVMFPGLVNALYWDSDAASALVLAEGLRGEGPVYIPHFGWWTSLWWLLATRDLPGHEQLWQATGYVFALSGAGLVGWATGRVAGRWAGVMAAAAALVVGPVALRSLLTVNYHVSTPFSACVLAAYLVLLARHRARSPAAGGVGVLVAIAVGLLAGMNAASDPLLWAAGIAPFAVAAAILAATARRIDVVVRATITLAVAVLTAQATNELMYRLGFNIINGGIEPAGVADIGANALKLGRLTALLGGANYVLPGDYPPEPVRTLVALLVFGAVAATVFSAIKQVVRPSEPIMLAYACYWAAATLLLGIAFVASKQGTGVGPGGFLYLLTLAPALGAGTAVLAAGSRRGELAVGLSVAVIGAANIAGLMQGRAGTPEGAIGEHKQQLIRLLEREGVTRGYAGYWDAANLTWQSGRRLQVAPVSECDPPRERELCVFWFFTISSSFEERAGPSFLIVDPDTAYITEPPPIVTDASASYRFGRLTVYLFPYDLARLLQRP